MSRLVKLVTEHLVKAGRNGKTHLCAKADISPSTLRDVLLGHIPKRENVYNLALACGCSEVEAQVLADEFAPLPTERASKRSA